MTRSLAPLLALLCAAALAGTDVPLQAPLCTVARVQTVAPGAKTIELDVVVPRDAPGDLGVGAFVADRDGRWFQRCRPGVLAPGRHRLRFAMTAADALHSEPARWRWSADQTAGTTQAGAFFWSATGSRAVLRIERLVATPAADTATSGARLLDIDPQGCAGAVCRATTGDRWSVTLRPDPYPADPYDADAFACELVVTEPDGRELRLGAFHRQPMRLVDRGDCERAVPTGDAAFEARWRPRMPGTHVLRLEARWGGTTPRTAVAELPPLEVSGRPWDGYLRVDRSDPRFFAVDGRWTYPVGLNLHSTFDLRSRERIGTVVTPARGTQVYRAMLQRLAAAGGDACEIWMSSWNLALEWRGDWPGYAGLGRYNQENAWRLDEVLDMAWGLGIRVNLVINNHGQVSSRADREWPSNPYNAALGGPCPNPQDFFTDPRALAWQERTRRYLVARYADHPAIMGWKLFSEVNLTAANGPLSGPWHAQAAARWRALDAYGHPVTAHWSGDYKVCDPRVAEIADIGYLCIDAYRRQGTPLTPLLWDSLHDSGQGLLRWGKPLVVTEYGAGWQAGTHQVLTADLACAPWIGFIAGHGAAPMTWWWEWVDQGDRWESFTAIRRFVAGEDPRGADARAARLEASGSPDLWAGAWVRPGRALGYLCDIQWNSTGRRDRRVEAASVVVGAQVRPGTVRVEWWDADKGVVLRRETVEHAGGTLRLAVPTFSGHIAFKAMRADEQASATGSSASD